MKLLWIFSCHSIDKYGRIEHKEWIDTKQGKFPNYDFVKALKSILDKDNGTIFRYADHENTVLRQIQRQMIDDNEEKNGEWIEWIDNITQWNIIFQKPILHGGSIHHWITIHY